MAANPLVQRYRDYLDREGKVDPRSDDEITLQLGNALRAQGEDIYDAKAREFPEFHEQYLAASQATDRGYGGEIMAGMKRGVEGLGATGLGVLALGAKAVGATDTGKALAQKAREIETPDNDSSATVQRLKDVHDTESAVRYGLGKTGEVLPNIAEAIVTALVGSAIGTAAEPGGGTVVGGLGGLIAKSTLKQMLRKEAYKDLGEVGLEQALKVEGNTALKTAFAQEARNVAQRMGGEAASYLNAAALGAGSTFNRTENVGAALGAGAVGGVAGALLPASIVSKWFPANSAAGTFMARLGREFPKSIALGTVGTVGQELANLTAEKLAKGEPATLTPADLERLKEASIGGAIGGVIGAPLAAAGGDDQAGETAQPERARAMEARRAAMLPPAEATPRTKSRGEVLREAMALAPEDQDARLTVLDKMSQRTPLENQELDLIRALVAQRPKDIAATSEPAAPASPSPLPTPDASTVSPPPTPALVAPESMPAVATPPPSKPAGLQQRVQAIGNKLYSLTTSLPKLDVSDVTGKLDAVLHTGKITAEDVASLESSMATLQEKGILEAARVAAEKAQAAAKKATAKEEAAAAKAKLKAEEEAARAKSKADAAAELAIASPDVAPETPSAPEPPAPALAESPDPLVANLDQALNAKPTFAAGRIDEAGIVDFDASRSGMYFDKNGNGSLTRTAIALQMPDGRVVQAGLLKPRGKGLYRVGADPKSSATETGPAVQRMSTRPTSKAPKSIEVGGKDPVLLDDLIKSGAKPFEVVKFDREPGQIFEVFENRDAYETAKANTERKVQSVPTVDQGVVTNDRGNLDAAEVAENEAAVQQSRTANTVTPAEELADIFRFNPEIESGFRKNGGDPQAAYAQMSRNLRAKIDAALAEAGVTHEDLFKYVSETRTSEPSTPATSPAESDVPSTAFGRFAAAIAAKPTYAEKLFKLIDRHGGSFETALKKMGSDNVESLNTAVEKFGADWAEVLPRVQKAFDTSDGTSASFVERLRSIKRRDIGERIAPNIDRTEQFSTLVERLARNGIDVQRIPGLDGDAATVDGKIVLATADTVSANLENLVALIHEVGHVESDRVAPGMREALAKAVDRTFAAVRDGELIQAADNANLDWEEKLVETFAIKLGEEGIADQTLAAAVWRTVKDTYLRAAMAVARAFGIEPSDAHVLAWFENNLRRRLGGDYDYRFVDLFRPFVERSAERVTRFAIIDGQDVPDLYNPVTRQLQQAEALPETVDAAMWNLERKGDVRFRQHATATDELDLDYTSAMARVQSAAWGELMPVIQKLKAELGSNLTDAQFWKVFSSSDHPAEIVKALENRVPGSGTAKIGSADMTEPMNQRATFQAFRLANALTFLNRKRAAATEEALDTYTDRIVKEAKILTRVDREHRNAAEMGAVLNDELRTLVKELALDLDRGPDTAHQAGELLGAIRAVENLTPKQAIPEVYQRVFKVILDGGGNTSVYDYMTAIARLELPLEKMKPAEVVAGIKANAAGDPRLKALAAEPALMTAIATLATKATREVYLLQLNRLQDSAEYIAIKADLDEIRAASEARLDEIAKGIEATQEHATLREKLRKAYVEARQDFNRTRQSIQRMQEKNLLRRKFADAMAQKAVDLSRDVGAFSYWDAHHGATYTVMTPDERGGWTASKRTLRMVGDDIGEQHEQVAQDLAANRLYLEARKDDAGSRVYEEVRRQTEQLSQLDFRKKYQAAHQFWFDKFLQPLGQKYAGTGTIAGTKIKQMLNAWQNVMFAHGDQIEATARRWNKALQEASDAAGYTNPRRFFDEVMNDVIYRLESEPGRDRTAARREARKAAGRRVPSQHAVAENFGAKVDALIELHKEMSELLDRVKEKNGLYVDDRRVKDPLTAKGNLQRHAIKYGYVTGSRRLKAEVVRTLVNDMQGQGWTDQLFADLGPDAPHEELIGRYFPPSVVRSFVEPFVMKPGKEVFRGAKDENGRQRWIAQVDAQHLWHEAGGDVLKWIDAMFDYTNQANNRDGLSEYRSEMLQRFGHLYTMESRLAAKASLVKSAFDPENKSHALMDARVNDLIPPEQFSYDTYSPTDARKKLTEIAFHAAFGRDGNALDLAMTDLQADIRRDADNFRLLPRATRQERRTFAEAKGWNFEKIVRAAEIEKDLRTWNAKLWRHFTGREAVLGDTKVLLELAQLNMSLVLNQPKSALWNLLSILEYPLVYRGIGKTSVRATATAARVFARETASSLFQVAGLNFLRAAEYAEIAEAVERKQTDSLPLLERKPGKLLPQWGALLSDMGPDGKFTEGGVANRAVQAARGAQTVLRKGVGKGNFSALWAPFNFASAKLDTAIATANVQALEMVVQRGIAYFESHPEARNNPAFRFTADHLGMKKGVWFSDQGAFDYFRERAMEYRLGNLEQIARDAAVRVQRGERLLTRDQALGAAMMALNEITLQSSINSRPVEFLDNPVLRLGGLMLGWPLAKMNQIHDAFKTPDGRASARSVLRAIGVMAAWSLPAGLAYSLLMDEYDEQVLGKKSNLRGIDPIALTPVVGPVLAAADGRGNVYGMLERLARAGVYGLGGDFVNSLTNVVDAKAGQRDFDLNSRVLVFSQFANLRDTLTNLIHQDFAYTYQSVGRPFLMSAGGAGMLQAVQIVNRAFQLSPAEAAVTNRINVNNALRAAGREAGIELRVGGGGVSPTPLSVWIQEMKTTALSNDRLGFLEAYRHAVDVARGQGEIDPENKVVEAFKSRAPLESIFARQPTEAEMGKLYAVMDDSGRRAVLDATTLFDTYAEMIAPMLRPASKPARPISVVEIRRQLANQARGL